MSNAFLNNDFLFHEVENEVLHEPVPFEDFKFSFGMNPDFLDPPDFPSMMPEPFDISSNTVLDENDQKAFSSFLDAFFLDPNMQPEPLNDNEYYYPQKDHQEDELRRTTILQSLDEQKKLHQRLNLIASLPKSNSIDLLTPSSESVSEDSNTPQTIYLRSSDSIHSPYVYDIEPTTTTTTTINRKKRTSSSASETKSVKKMRGNKELLSEEEKRANHIASEQKRRGVIRHGFKELTELVPTLKNINNSKSTVLFKAVEFIRHLEKRNKNLKEKIESLELRIKVEDRMTHHAPVLKKDLDPLDLPSIKTTFTKHLFADNDSSLPANTRNALMAHKTQQKQLLLLQEQLQLHQRLIAQQQEIKEKTPYHQQRHTTSSLEDKAISASI